MSFGLIKWHSDIIEKEKKEIDAETARKQVVVAIENKIQEGLTKINRAIQEASLDGKYYVFVNVFDIIANDEACDKIEENLTNRGFKVDVLNGKISWKPEEE